MEKKKVSEAQMRAVTKYSARVYDQIRVVIPKGKREQLKTIIEQHEQSMNSFIKDAIIEKIHRSGIDFEW